MCKHGRIGGEALLDLRKGATLRRGSLAELARGLLLPAWAAGSAGGCYGGARRLPRAYDAAIIECCPYTRQEPTEQVSFRQWAGQVSAWLYDTRHIEIAYGIQFDARRRTPVARHPWDCSTVAFI
jgi:hypothetical protein